MMEDRPPPSPRKLLGQFNDWMSGTELPGRTMSYLKTGGLPELLTRADGVDGVDGVEAMVEAWSGWEAGTTNPTAVLEVLRDAGIETLLLGLVET